MKVVDSAGSKITTDYSMYTSTQRMLYWTTIYDRGGEPFQRRVPIFRHLNAQNIWRAKTKK